MKSSKQARSIYALIDPRNGKIMYIGSSVNPKDRYNKHIWRARPENRVKSHNRDTNVQKQDWICELLALGLKPVLQIIANETINWAAIEEHMIEMHGELNIATKPI